MYRGHVWYTLLRGSWDRSVVLMRASQIQVAKTKLVPEMIAATC